MRRLGAGRVADCNRASTHTHTLLGGDEAGIVFGQLCDALELRIVVAFSSASGELHAPTTAVATGS